MRIQTMLNDGPAYLRLRQSHPLVPARKVWDFVRDDRGMRFAEFICPKHEWAFTGTQYGGDDESYGGEGRCYCVNCGADGDA